MAEYSNDEERLLAIVDFFKHYQKSDTFYC